MISYWVKIIGKIFGIQSFSNKIFPIFALQNKNQPDEFHKQKPMSVKIRLARRGRKKMAIYDVLVTDSRSSRNGRFIEKLGQYNPNTNPATINIDTDKALDWVMKGALPTETTKTVLSRVGVMYRKHLQVGVNKGAITQEQADERFAKWLSSKDSKTQSVLSKLAADKAAKAQARLDTEAKVKEAKLAAIEKKNKVEEPVAETAASEEVAAEEPTAEAPAEEAAAE